MTLTSYLSDWSIDPPIILGVFLAALLYWRGWRSLMVVRGDRTDPLRPWHALAFAAGLLTILLALESPIDALSASLFWAHMLQHLLLIMIAAPLLILGDPLVPMLRGIPLQLRRGTLGLAARQTWVHKVMRALSWLTRPGPVFVIFLADLYVWHWNYLFNLTLQNDAVHIFEHICFLVTALLFWSQVIDQRTVRAQLPYAQRALYTVVTAMAGNILAMYFVFTPRPLYVAYAHVTHRLYGISALTDQQLAGGLMWVPVLFLFGGACAVCFFKALAEEENSTQMPAGHTPYSVLLPPRDGSIPTGIRSR